MIGQGVLIIGILVWLSYLGIFWLYGVKHWFAWATLIAIASMVSLQLVIEFLAPAH